MELVFYNDIKRTLSSCTTYTYHNFDISYYYNNTSDCSPTSTLPDVERRKGSSNAERSDITTAQLTMSHSLKEYYNTGSFNIGNLKKILKYFKSYMEDELIRNNQKYQECGSKHQYKNNGKILVPIDEMNSTGSRHPNEPTNKDTNYTRLKCFSNNKANTQKLLYQEPYISCGVKHWNNQLHNYQKSSHDSTTRKQQLRKIHINILDYTVEKVVSTNWKTFLSGFYITNSVPSTIYIVRSIEWERTLIHELVHCCYNIYNEIETEEKTIHIYRKLFSFSESQSEHSYKLYRHIINQHTTNLYKYVFAYLSSNNNSNYGRLANGEHTDIKRCKCTFDHSFTYLCD